MSKDTKKAERIAKEVGDIFPMVSLLLEGEKTTAVAAFLIGGRIAMAAALDLKVSPEDLQMAFNDLIKDYVMNSERRAKEDAAKKD